MIINLYWNQFIPIYERAQSYIGMITKLYRNHLNPI